MCCAAASHVRDDKPRVRSSLRRAKRRQAWLAQCCRPTQSRTWPVKTPNCLQGLHFALGGAVRQVVCVILSMIMCGVACELEDGLLAPANV